MDLNKGDVELKLLLGLPIAVEGLGSFRSPKVIDVAMIGEAKYNEYLGVLLFSKENVDKSLTEDLTDFQLFCIFYLQVDHFRNQVNDALRFFMNSEVHFHSISGFFDLVNEETTDRLDESNFYILQKCIRYVNSIMKQEKEAEQYNPADEETARVIAEMLERRKARPKPQPIIDLCSMISGMSWKCPSVDISEKTIFQLYDGFKRLQNLDSMHYTMVGIYTGNVDAKKINMKDLNFALILKD